MFLVVTVVPMLVCVCVCVRTRARVCAHAAAAVSWGISCAPRALCRAAPEAVVKAQLAALQEGDVFGASCYNMWHRKGLTSRKTSAAWAGLAVVVHMLRWCC